MYPECQSKDSSIFTMCKIGEAFVLVINIVCFFLGFCVYIWFAWMERREKITGRGKKVCAQLSTWRVFQPCCKKGFGQWLRNSQVVWSDNPLDAPKVDIEMTQPESVLEGVAKSVLESKLKEENKGLKEENKVLKEEVKTLKATIKRLTLYNNSATIRKKNSNSWRTTGGGNSK